MSFKHLLSRLAHQYPARICGLARDMNVSEKTLYNKLDPNQDTHHMNPDDVELLAFFCGANLEIARFFAEKENASVVTTRQPPRSDMELLDMYLSVLAEMGNMSKEFQEDWADGVITRTEFNRIVKESDLLISRIIELRDGIGKLVTD